MIDLNVSLSITIGLDCCNSCSQKAFHNSCRLLWIKPPYNFGWALWNQNSFEFKFDDTRLSSYCKNKIGCLNFFLLRPDFAKSGRNNIFFLMGPILFLYYKESLISSNLNSKILWFHSVRPILHTFECWLLLGASYLSDS